METIAVPWPRIDIVGEKVRRLYGGLSRSLYTCHPLDFRQDPNRPLLSAPGGWLFNTWVNVPNLGKRQVQRLAITVMAEAADRRGCHDRLRRHAFVDALWVSRGK